MIRILCIDDDLNFLNKIKDSLIHYPDIKTLSYQSIPSTLPIFDACILDIKIHDQLSYKWAKELIDKPIIYISHYDEYVFDVVKMRVFDYIRKSRFDDEFHPSIQRLMKYLYNKDLFISFKYKSQDYRISLLDILYIETYSHQTIIHTINNEIYDIKKSYTDFNIDSSFIVRTHKSYMINMYHCLSLSKNNAYLKNNKVIPISFRKYQEVLHYFKHFQLKSY